MIALAQHHGPFGACNRCAARRYFARIALERVIGLGHKGLASQGGMALLQNVDQLMAEQVAAFVCMGLEATRAEVDVLPHGVGAGVHRFGRACRLGIGVYAHIAQGRS